MSDDLRTRIAAVIHAQNVSEYCGTIHPEDVLRLADAVIRAVEAHRREVSEDDFLDALSSEADDE